jgi:nucleoside-diphosphate-sugar epimerase
MAPFRFSEWIRRGEPITLYGDGEQTRDFTYIDDIARGTLAALKPLGYEIINLGGGNSPISINEMIHQLEDELGSKAIVDYQTAFAADMQDTAADISKASALLNWKPEISPAIGLKQTAQWHRANGAWLDHIEL